MLNILETILEHKRQAIANTADYYDLVPSQRSLFKALCQPHYGFIMECKKASPSRGLIRAEFNLDEIVPVYEQYADAISVLTEERFFRGSFANLQKVRTLTDKPILCKDFILSPKQIRQARHFGADAVLLMLSVLNDRDYRSCQQQAEALNMDIITEVHTEAELERAIKLGSKIVGINNRNLKDLSTSLNHTRTLAEKVPNGCLLITESGIGSHQDVLELSSFTDACLVGSSLMQESDLDMAARQLVYGDIKVCGVTQQLDVDQLQQLPVSSIGLVFAHDSKRLVTRLVKSEKPLVGVFQDQTIDEVVSTAQVFQLKAIQLHGDESLNFAQEIKHKLPLIKLSKVYHVGSDFSAESFKAELSNLLEHYDEVLLDSEIITEDLSQRGGTGMTFDWSLVNSLNFKRLAGKIRVAGGISASNIETLKQLGVVKVDLSSSLESSPGLKNKELIEEFFAKARPQSGRQYYKSTIAVVDLGEDLEQAAGGEVLS